VGLASDTDCVAVLRTAHANDSASGWGVAAMQAPVRVSSWSGHPSMRQRTCSARMSGDWLVGRKVISRRAL
jgi:hypothetical protein